MDEERNAAAMTDPGLSPADGARDAENARSSERDAGDDAAIAALAGLFGEENGADGEKAGAVNSGTNEPGIPGRKDPGSEAVAAPREPSGAEVVPPDGSPDGEETPLAGPPGNNTANDETSRGGRGLFAAVLAAFLCAVSVLAFVCAGAFVADAFTQAEAPESGGIAQSGGEDSASTAAKTPGDLREQATDTARNETDQVEEPGGADQRDVFPVEHLSMAADELFAVSNMTGYEPDVPALTSVAAFAAAAPSPSGGPSVLVIHTHATEAYIAEGETQYDDQTSFRSSDAAGSVIAVGDEICAVLDEAGIETVHCTEKFDAADFQHAYDESAAAVREYLAEYPGICLVLDVHRDALFRPDGTLLAPTSEDGAAQVMLVCGTDEMGAIFPDWRDNLSFAFSVQAAAGAKYPDLMRGVNLRGASFNEQLAERYLLVEVGSAGNTLAEAKAGARKFAEVLAKVIGK